MGDVSVLFVERSADARSLLRTALAECDCSFASSAYEALRQLNVHAFDAYVLDDFMPDWSGPLLCREIRKQDPHSPVILCAQEIDIDGRKPRSAGASAYLKKPVYPDVLALKLRELLLFAASENVLAAKQAERAFLAELSRRGVTSISGDETRRALARAGARAESIERTAHARAHRSFIDAGGTRARFDRWWTDGCSGLFPRK